jgi:hypothetical protein
MQELIKFLDCVDDPRQLLFYSEKGKRNAKLPPAMVSVRNSCSCQRYRRCGCSGARYTLH